MAAANATISQSLRRKTINGNITYDFGMPTMNCTISDSMISSQPIVFYVRHFLFFCCTNTKYIVLTPLYLATPAEMIRIAFEPELS